VRLCLTSLEAVIRRSEFGEALCGVQRHKPEEIVAKLRQVEVLVGRDQTVVVGARAIRVTGATYYRWRAEYGSLTLG
jgi:hypothetical protein